MTTSSRFHTALLTAVAGAGIFAGAPIARADGNLGNVNHIIIVMMENHSFDNYFGVLGYVAGTPYHNAHRRRGCDATDTTCVDGLRCKPSGGGLVCRNHNSNTNAPSVHSFHLPRYCIGPDLDHSWIGSHEESNFKHPAKTLRSSPNNGFVKVNNVTNLPNTTQAVNHDTMGYFDDGDLPFYFDIAKTFAMSDRYFCDVIGQTFPNRSYFLAGTSFGHLTTSEILVSGGYKPITGTIFDRMDAAGVTWKDYASDLPYSLIFHTSSGHTATLAAFAADAAAGTLPDVAFVDPSVFSNQSINGSNYETDEHPPADVRAGEYFVSTIANELRNGPNWSDSILFWTYDEHGGYYDHVKPAPAPQGGAATPDGISPGQCADESNPPASEQPGGGANCNVSATGEAPGICPDFTPTGPYPANCATFNQLGFRVPFVAISPFSKPHYVSHVVSSHTSFLALIEKRFSLAPLTARDANSNDLEDLFDFDNSPSVSATLSTAPLPQQPPAQMPGDPGCPFS
jgi:phospholipase C